MRGMGLVSHQENGNDPASTQLVMHIPLRDHMGLKHPAVAIAGLIDSCLFVIAQWSCFPLVWTVSSQMAAMTTLLIKKVFTMVMLQPPLFRLGSGAVGSLLGSPSTSTSPMLSSMPMSSTTFLSPRSTSVRFSSMPSLMPSPMLMPTVQKTISLGRRKAYRRRPFGQCQGSPPPYRRLRKHRWRRPFGQSQWSEQFADLPQPQSRSR